MSGTQKPFVFISYTRADGFSKAKSIEKHLVQHDVSVAVDWLTPPRIGEGLNQEIMSMIAGASIFLPVFTSKYGRDWTLREYEYAKQLGKRIVPVVVGPLSSVTWLKAKKRPAWIQDEPMIIALGELDEERRPKIEKLLAEVSPSSFVIKHVDAIAASDPEQARQKLSELMREVPLSGEQLARVDQYRAEFFRRSGHRDEARAVIKSLIAKVTADSPFDILQKTLVTSALLAIDDRAYDEARSNLAEATAILSRSTTFESDDQLLRRRLLAEVTRELARTYLSEALDEPHALDSCYDLEVAWALYLEALALVTEGEDKLCYAWVHENLGLLTTAYAKRSLEAAKSGEKGNGNGNGSGAQPRTAIPPFMDLDYPFIGRYRGNTEYLLTKSEGYLRNAQRLFHGYTEDAAKQREGLGWTMYHQVERRLLHAENEWVLEEAVRELHGVLDDFAGVPEGQALTYAQLFDICRKLRRRDEARSYGEKAIALARTSQKHQRLIEQIQQQLDSEA